jgi:hypothetical protein
MRIKSTQEAKSCITTPAAKGFKLRHLSGSTKRRLPENGVLTADEPFSVEVRA